MRTRVITALQLTLTAIAFGCLLSLWVEAGGRNEYAHSNWMVRP